MNRKDLRTSYTFHKGNSSQILGILGEALDRGIYNLEECVIKPLPDIINENPRLSITGRYSIQVPSKE